MGTRRSMEAVSQELSTTRLRTDESASISQGGVLLCTLCCPWPDRPEQGLYNQEQAAALIANGIDASLFAPGPALLPTMGIWPRFSSHAARPRSYEVGGVPVHAPRIPFAFPEAVRAGCLSGSPKHIGGWMRRAAARHLDMVIEETRPRALLLHGASPWGRIGIDAARRYDLDAFFIEHSRGDLNRARMSTALREEYRWVDDSCSGWVTVSSSMHDALIELVPSARAIVIENGARCLKDELERPSRFEGKTVVFSAGHYYRRKRFEALVDAFAEVSAERDDLVLVLAAGMPRELRRRAAALGDKVESLGPLSHADLLRWMQWSDLFALPSSQEAFGIVYAEALLAGTPVLLSADCGLANSLRLLGAQPGDGSWDGWVVDGLGSGALTQALARATQSAELLAAMGAGAKSRAAQRFDWSRNAHRLAGFMGLNESDAEDPCMGSPRRSA